MHIFARAENETSTKLCPIHHVVCLREKQNAQAEDTLWGPEVWDLPTIVTKQIPNMNGRRLQEILLGLTTKPIGVT